MNEGLNQDLQKEWDKKLAEAGMPEELSPIKTPPRTISGRETLTSLVPNIEQSLDRFIELPDKLQGDILIDLKKKREAGMPPKQILVRFDVLLAKSEELDKLTVADSDEVYNPNPAKDGPDLEKEKEIGDRVDKLIERMEEEVNKPADTEHIN